METTLTRQMLIILSKGEIEHAVPEGTFHRTLQQVPWSKVVSLVMAQPDFIQHMVLEAINKKISKRKRAMVTKKMREVALHRSCSAVYEEGSRRWVSDENPDVEMGQRTDDGEQNKEGEYVDACHSTGKYSDFMKLAMEDERKACYQDFIKATSNEALLQSICIVCA